MRKNSVRPELEETGRNPSPCKLYRKCGGCQLQNMTYERQLSYKQAKVVSLLGRFCRVEPIIGMKHPYHYRNKVQAAFTRDRNGRIVSGVYQSSTHRVVPVTKCQLEDLEADRIISTIRSLMPSFRMQPYDEISGKGFLRHVLVKRGFRSGEIMVVLVGGNPVFPAKKRFVSALLERHPEITTVIFNLNRHYTSLVLGEREEVLYGKGYIEEQLCGCTFRISAKSFYQINPIQTQVLYRKALEMAGLTGKETVVDAYCGTGTIGILAAKHAGQVIGVELNRDAVRDAISNARKNECKNIFFHCADAGEFLVQMAKEKKQADVVLMDPPRAGSDRAFLSSVTTLSPKRVVYISCNPETQQRDLTDLVRQGYAVRQIQPVDMFPHTSHVETVALLSRKTASKSFIPVSISPKDMGLSEEKDQPTYANIRDYVQKTYGMKVSSLYVAQMKVECGLETQADRSGDKKQPKCPPEKREAILDAFRHFGLIGEDETEK